MNHRSSCILAVALFAYFSQTPLQAASLVADGAKVKKLAAGFRFTEGPAWGGKKSLFFSDIPNERIHRWSDGKLTTFRENSGRANGLYFDHDGNLLMCEGGARRVTRSDMRGNITEIASRYEGKLLNSPNDLWVDPEGGIYFTDPRYGRDMKLDQDGFHVYYLASETKKVVRVIDDLVKPNGIIGTRDGKKLFVADPGASKSYVYSIGKSGELSHRKLAAPEGSDGMTLDERGNLYLTRGGVKIYSPKGELLETIEVPEGPANVTFGGKDGRTLFITAKKSLYSIRMKVKGQHN